MRKEPPLHMVKITLPEREQGTAQDRARWYRPSSTFRCELHHIDFVFDEQGKVKEVEIYYSTKQ